ncbi:Ion channel [Dictyocaulus viviparus]|uniref:Ion channel n=1 Tax=Dictyocaulus viviparus TaxID=29172 RepID=A0A0D8XCD8_DICVI|nr:Ion channel [Dictyocaulus viviparus]
MSNWKTINEFYEHSDVATVRLDDFNKSAFYFVGKSLSYIDKKIGLRHLFLLFLLTVYSLLGGYYIYHIEGKAESKAVPARKAVLEEKILEIAKRYKNNNVSMTLIEKVADLKRDYIDMLNIDGNFKWSTYEITDKPDHWKWTIGSSFFYSMSVYTTVGYGSIAPETVAAKCVTIFYGMLFCPVTWIIVRDIGQLALVYLTTLYARLKLKFSSVTEKQDQVFILPFWICITICGSMGPCVIMGSGTIWVYYFDKFSGLPESGIDLFHALYFTFQTFSTIGLGDVMPNNVTFDPIICSVFFFSLPMLKVVNRMTYLGIENGVYGAFELLSNKLSNYCHSPPKTTSHSESAEKSHDDRTTDEGEIVNQLSIHSIATFMRSNADVYGGRLGQVNLRASDLESD